MKPSLIILSLAILCSCNFVDDDYSVIPPEVKPHVEEFFKIAHDKGLNISPYQLKIYYSSIGDNFVAGNTHLSEEVINIDSTSTAWAINPESVIFHELGHLYLHRGHDDEFIDGYEKSLMNTYGVLYAPKTRPYYIDELFDPNTKTQPNWD
jgi:hypothetical protein